MGKGSKNCVFAGCCCNYTSLTTDLVIGCAGSETCLCFESVACCAAGKKGFPIGLIKEEGAIIKCGLPCCTYGLVKPSVCVQQSGECLCVKSAASFPFKEGFVPGFMCAILGLTLCGENTGCLAEPPAFNSPGGGAAPVSDMER